MMWHYIILFYFIFPFLSHFFSPTIDLHASPITFEILIGQSARLTIIQIHMDSVKRSIKLLASRDFSPSSSSSSPFFFFLVKKKMKKEMNQIITL